MGPFAWRRLAAALCFLAALPAADFTTYIGDTNDYRVARVLGRCGREHLRRRQPRRRNVRHEAGRRGQDRGVRHAQRKGHGHGRTIWRWMRRAISISPGSTNSVLLPLRNALQATPGPGFVVKFNPDAHATDLLDLLSRGHTGAGAGCGGQRLCHGLHLLLGISGHAGSAGGDSYSARVDQRHVRRVPHQNLGGGGSHCLFYAHLRPPEELRRGQQLLPEQPEHGGHRDRGGCRGQRVSRRQHRHGRPAHDYGRPAHARHRRVRRPR